MAYSHLDAKTREIAERILTRKQLDVFRLWCAGAGTARIALMVGVSEPVARRTLERAKQLIVLSIEQQVVEVIGEELDEPSST